MVTDNRSEMIGEKTNSKDICEPKLLITSINREETSPVIKEEN